MLNERLLSSQGNASTGRKTYKMLEGFRPNADLIELLPTCYRQVFLALGIGKGAHFTNGCLSDNNKKVLGRHDVLEPEFAAERLRVVASTRHAGQVAQSVEQRTENPRVASSILALTT